MSRKAEIIKNILQQSLGESGLDFNALLTKMDYNDQNKITFWKDLIERIQEQQGENGVVDGTTHPYPVRKNDLPDDENSLLKIIIDCCDLKSDDLNDIELSKLYKMLRGDGGEDVDFWNESVQQLVDKIKDLEEEEENPVILPIDGGIKDIRLNDLKMADAGNNYLDPSANCVEPFINVNEKTYDKVRNTDQVKDTVKNLSKMDFTNNHTDWITLLMPRYGRTVQIEDLNRNFWVINEALSGLMNWFYGASPVNEILKRLIDETTQLWENMLYLWLQVALMNQKKSEQIQVLVEPARLYKNEFLTKYDNIPTIKCEVEDNNFTIVSNLPLNYEYEYFKHFQEEYSDSVVGILPIYRINNYRSNYYCGELYQKFLIFDNNITDENGNAKFLEFKIVESYENNTRPVVISPRYEVKNNEIGRFSSRIFATKPIDFSYYYTYPFSEVNKKVCQDGRVLLYGALLVKQSIMFSKQIDGSIKFSDFTLTVYDAAAPIGNPEIEDYRALGRFKLKNSNDTYNENNDTIKLIYEQFSFEQEPMTTVEKRNCGEISKAYYLGEVASWRGRATKS